MELKNLLKYVIIIVPITIIITFFTTKFNWFGIYFTAALIFKVLISFGLTCVFMQLFKSKIKSWCIFLLIVLGTAAGYFLAIDLAYHKTIHIILFFLYLLIGTLFGWGASVVQNRFIRVSFWFIGIFYMQIFIMNEPDLEIIDWLMYIPAFILGIWACKRFGYEKKLQLLPLLLWVLNEVFVFSVLLISIISIDEMSFKDISITAIVYQIVTFWALWLVYCCGFWFIKTQKIFIKILLPIFVVLLALILLNQVRTLLLQRFVHNTWTGEISKPAKLSEIEFFTDSTLNKVTIQDLQKEVYVLDFYNNNCGNCFEQMPKFQTLAEKYKENTDIGFYAVNVFRDTINIAQAQRFLEKQNINVPLLFICEKDEKYVQNFGYKLFPQYNIVKNDTIIFDGYFEILDFFERKYLK